LALGVWVFWRKGLHFPRSTRRIRFAPARGLLRTWLAVGAAVLLLVSLVNFVEDWLLAFFAQPEGNWDAWSIWNLHARFISSGGAAWLAGFTSEMGWWSHADYPLLLPGFVARLWGLLSTQSQWVPALVEMTFLFSILGVVVAGVWQAQGWKSAVFAGLFTVPVLHYSIAFQQYADMPLAFFLLVANLLLVQSESSQPGQVGRLALAGFAVGAAVWTKNEGWAFVLALVLVEGLRFSLERPAFATWARRCFWLALGALPMVAAALVFKLYLTPPNDIMYRVGQGGLLALLTDSTRYKLIWSSFLDHFFEVGSLKVAVLPALIGYGLLLGWNPIRRSNLGRVWIGLRLFVVGLVYFCIFLVTPHPLEWHLTTAMSRLICHLLPSLILMIFLQVKSLDELPETA